VAFAHLGRDEESIATLERAVAQRVDAVLVTAVHPAFRSLRANPRFTAVVRRIGLQPR
jgi:hypothetical protein